MVPTWRMDPRPDLATDHALWHLLLTEIVQDEELGWTLNGARCAGCQIVHKGSGFAIQPIIDPKLGFNDEAEWIEFRAKWLVPMQAEIAQAMRELRKRATMPDATAV
ncbi:MAG: hypothetical protein K6T76_12955 [Alicyclobacillus mali]|uniref:hypothetical protein n=1 Tax=Alicyclobacillus mali (ex Roth et al. 2021) TaxID=1123961 RepID=UPI0023F211F2|nr:hypothetical protein [Alicyclobacillus mali (ex Roth et al. 2021)]MCL6489826.1 hypothetical protein [Alicyclobacillus mali (ex Roth et al. 2021)]